MVGCAMGPDYERPDATILQTDKPFLDSGQPATIDSSKDSRSVALLDWESVYQDPELRSLIEEGLQNNLDLEIARSRLRQASASARIARSPLWPSASVDFEAERERDPGANDNIDTFSLFGFLSWELDLWGINRRSAQAADAQQIRAEFDVQAARVSLIAAIASNYFELASINNQLKVTRDTIITRREALRIIQRRKENGIISGLEVRQAEFALAEAVRKEPELVLIKQQRENTLNILLGRSPREISQTVELKSLDLPKDIPIGLPGDLLLRRPDIQAAEQDLIAANARIGVAMGSFLPRIKLTGEFGLGSNDIDRLLSGGNEYFDLIGNISAPIFNAGANVAAYEKSLALRDEALIAYRRSVLVALEEVSNSLTAYHQSKIQEEATYQLLKAANEYHRLAVLRYRNGILAYIDVLDAQRQLFNAELSLNDARRDRLIASASIYKSLGGGWNPPSPGN